ISRHFSLRCRRPSAACAASPDATSTTPTTTTATIRIRVATYQRPPKPASRFAESGCWRSLPTRDDSPRRLRPLFPNDGPVIFGAADAHFQSLSRGLVDGAERSDAPTTRTSHPPQVAQKGPDARRD